MAGVLPLMVTTTTVPALIQGQGEMDNSMSTLSGLTKEKWIGQLNAISTVRSFLNLSSKTMDEVRNKGPKKDKLIPVVDTQVAHPTEDMHSMVSSSATCDDTLPSEVSQTMSWKTGAIKKYSILSAYKEAAKLTYLGAAILFPLEEPFYEIQNLIGITWEQKVWLVPPDPPQLVHQGLLSTEEEGVC